MKRRNLADVLLKILGLSMCLYAIPSVVISTCTFVITSVVGSKLNGLLAFNNALAFAITDGVRAVVGIYLIVKSQKIAERWFKNEEE
jgi:hypothetical protein